MGSDSEHPISSEEAALAELTILLGKEVAATRATVLHNLDEAESILRDLRERREKRLAAGGE